MKSKKTVSDGKRIMLIDICEHGKKWGHLGGKARAKNLSKAELSKIGKLGAMVRWAKKTVKKVKKGLDNA